MGISIARKNPRGREIILQSIIDYLGDRASNKDIEKSTIFIDEYTSGYAKSNEIINDTTVFALRKYGIPMDNVYTGKAFWGMSQYLKEINGKSVLFIHTGGTPLFFDNLLIER